MALYGWGYNGFGQIGTIKKFDLESEHSNPLIHRQNDIKSPTILSNDIGEIKGVAAGDAHSIFVTSFGEVLTQGRGKEGQLGIERLRDYCDVPRSVEGLKNRDISSVVAGSFTSFAITSSGLLYQWGRVSGERNRDDNDAAAGHLPGIRDNRRNNRRGDIFDRIIENSTQRWLSAEDQGVNLQDDEMIGSYDVPRLEVAESGVIRLQLEHRICASPILVRKLSRKRIVSASAGYAHFCCVSSDGLLFTCGYNDHGQLGMGHRGFVSDFTQVAALAKHFVVKVACGQQHSIALVAESNVDRSENNVALYSWGSGGLGQTGIGPNRKKASLFPNRVDETLDDRGSLADEAVDIACGSNHNLLITASGKVYGWGHSEYNQLGNSDDRQGIATLKEQFYYWRPRLLTGLENVHVVKAACGGNFSLAISKEKLLYSWGWNGHGTLGGGKYRVSPRPEQVPGLTGVECISAGMKHALAVADLMDGSPFGPPIFERLINKVEVADSKILAVGNNANILSEIHLHRCIITARCPQLDGQLSVAARFTKEEELPMVQLETELHEGLDAEVLMAVVTFIYTDRLKLKDNRKLSYVGMLALSLGLDRLAALCAYNQTWHQRKKWFSTKGSVTVDLPPSTFIEDMHNLLNSEKYADIQLKFEKTHSKEEMTVYNVHKVILSRFDYFNAMLCGSFSESKSSKNKHDLPFVNLSGFLTDGLKDGIHFRMLLIHAYSGTVEPPEHIATDMNALIGVLTTAQAVGMDNLVAAYERALGDFVLEDVSCAEDFKEFAESCGLMRLAQQCVDIQRYSQIE